MATVLDDGLMQQIITGNVVLVKRIDIMAANHDDEIRASQRRWTDGQNFDMRNMDVVVASQLALSDEAAGYAGLNASMLTPSVAQHPALPVPFGWPTTAIPQAQSAPKAAGT